MTVKKEFTLCGNIKDFIFIQQNHLQPSPISWDYTFQCLNAPLEVYMDSIIAVIFL
jgi:hypothetical protein